MAGALMYFATLTEAPVLQGLMGAGLGKGPALDSEAKREFFHYLAGFSFE